MNSRKQVMIDDTKTHFTDSVARKSAFLSHSTIMFAGPSIKFSDLAFT